MNPVIAAALASALVAAVSGMALAAFFHHNRGGAVALPIAFAFGAFSALLAYLFVYRVARRRAGRKKPVLGAMRGAALGLMTFFVATLGHTAIFPGQGGFFVSVIPIVLIGLAMFGWGAALIGAVVGVFCEHRYFDQPLAMTNNTDRSSRQNSKPGYGFMVGCCVGVCLGLVVAGPNFSEWSFLKIGVIVFVTGLCCGVLGAWGSSASRGLRGYLSSWIGPYS